MIFKVLLSRSVQTQNSDKNWQTSCPLQTFVCNISRHLEFIVEQGHRVAGFPGHWVTKCDPVPCLVRCTAMTMPVSSVRKHISKTDFLTSPNFRVTLSGRCSILLQRRCDMLYTSGFVDDVILAHHVQAHKRRREIPLGVRRGAKSAVYDCVVVWWYSTKRRLGFQWSVAYPTPSCTVAQQITAVSIQCNRISWFLITIVTNTQQHW